MLRYLACGLGLSIPSEVSTRLEQAIGASTLQDCEAAMFSAVAGSPSSFPQLWKRVAGWSVHLTLIKWALVPSPSLMQWKYRLRNKWLLPVYYLYRPIRLLLQTCAGPWQGHGRRW